MNKLLHPKRLILFMDEIHKDYPETKNSEEYRFYYLYTDYKTPQEFLIVIAGPDSLQKEAQKLHHSLQMWRGMFGFTEATVISEDDFQRSIETQLRDLQNIVRGTTYTSIFYEVW